MWRDVKLYLQALAKHWVTVAVGPAATLLLLLAEDVFRIDIPRSVLGLAAVAGVFVAGFKAWQDEHAKVAPSEADPEAFRRPEFEKQIAKLTPEQDALLRHVVRVGDSNAMHLRDTFFRDQGKSVAARDADLLLLGIAETTGILEAKERGTAFPRYGIKPVWQKLLVEWAAPPTVVDKRIADKAQELHRTLAASFEDWPEGIKRLDEMTTWAAKVAGGFNATEAVLKRIIELRPEASRRVERVVGTVSDAYYAAAGITNRLFRRGGLSINADNRDAVEAQLRDAERHVRQCIDALDRLTRDWS